MWQDEDLGTYYFLKMFVALIYRNRDNDLYKYADVLYDVEVFRSFEDTINEFSKREFIGDDAKRSIYEIIGYARDIKDENRTERLDICNNIIDILNMSKDRCLEFYIPQMIKRIETKRNLKKYTYDEMCSLIPLVHRSLNDDFLLLYSHGDDVDEETFLTYYLPQLTKSPFYFVSLDIMLNECPKLFENKEFLMRVYKTLSCSEFEDKKINKVIEKKIKKVFNKS